MNVEIDIGAAYGEEMRRFWLGPAAEQPAAAPPGPVTAGWVQRESGLPWLPLLLDFPYEESRLEVMRLLDRFVEHRAGEGRGWRSLCLHGPGSELTRSPRHHGHSDEDAPYGWTEIAERCPATAGFFRERYPMRRLLHVRFMLLEPGGYIAPHRDTPTHHLSAVSLAITNPMMCFFKMRGVGCVPFRAGRAFQLDIGHEHSSINLGPAPRIHVIVHAEEPTPAWDDLIVRSFHAHQAGADGRG